MIKSYKLSNGIKVVEEQRNLTDTISMVFLIKGGLLRENKDNNGIGELFSQVWMKSNKLMEKVEFYGGIIGASIGSDYFQFNISLQTEDFSKIMSSLRQCLLHPKLDKAVFDREKKLQMKEIETISDDPSAYSFKRFSQTTYNSNCGYSMPGLGELGSVASLTLENLKDYYYEIFGGINLVLSLVGNFDRGTINKIVDMFNKIDRGGQIKIHYKRACLSEGSWIEEENSEVAQSKMYIGYMAPAASDKHYIPLKIISEILGSGLSSRYFEILRGKKGYAYSVYSMYPSRICASRFIAYIGLDYKNVKHAFELIQEINSNFVNEITEGELEKAKNQLMGSILIDSQTNYQRAFYKVFFENLSMGYNFHADYTDYLSKINIDGLREATEIFRNLKTVYILKPTG